MRDDIIEACALALMNEHLQGQGHDAGQDFISETARQIWHKKARAALTAFKQATAEPTPRMLAVADESDIAGERERTGDLHWRCMHEIMFEDIGI